MGGDPPASPPREVKLLPPRFRPLLAPPRLLVLLALPRLVPLPPPPLSGGKRPPSGKERMRRLDLPIGPLLLLLLLVQAARTLEAAFRGRAVGDAGGKTCVVLQVRVNVSTYVLDNIDNKGRPT